MTPQEAEQIKVRRAARAAVDAKLADPDALLDDADCKLLSPAETLAAVNQGKVAGIAPDKRLKYR